MAERLERHTAEDVVSLAPRLNLKKLPRPAEGGDGTDVDVPWFISYDERTFAGAWQRRLLAQALRSAAAWGKEEASHRPPKQARYGKYSLVSMKGGMADEGEDG